MKRHRRRVRKGFRKAWLWLFVRDDGRCRICGGHTDPHVPNNHPDAPTADHIIPRARGGTDTMRTLQLAHRRCNEAKRDRPPPPNAADPLLLVCLREGTSNYSDAKRRQLACS